jgi:hypothetical protein
MIFAQLVQIIWNQKHAHHGHFIKNFFYGTESKVKALNLLEGYNTCKQTKQQKT